MLEVNNLSVTARSGAQLLNQISFQIEIGEAIGLTGQSGAGKTTLLKALLGILSGGCQVSGGTIQVDGQSLWTLPPRKRRELCGTTLGFIPQNPMTAFDPRLKMGRQMEETLRLRTGVFGKEAVERAETLLAELGLSHPGGCWTAIPPSSPAGCSSGQRPHYCWPCIPDIFWPTSPPPRWTRKIGHFCWSCWRNRGKPQASCLSPTMLPHSAPSAERSM